MESNVAICGVALNLLRMLREEHVFVLAENRETGL